MIYGLKLSFIALVSLPIGILVISLALFDRRGKLVYRLGRFWCWSILRIGVIGLKVEGLERLDPKRQYVFMANHQSNIDIPALIQALAGFQLRWLAKRELLWVPLFGWAMWASGHILVDRSSLSKAVASLRRAREKIEGGVSVVVFPEGTRSSHGRLLPFKRGGFALAIKTKTPIVPVTINGTKTILAKGDWRLRRGKIEIIISEPISVDQYPPGHLGQLLHRVRGVIESHCWPRGDSSRDGLAGAESSVSLEGFAKG